MQSTSFLKFSFMSTSILALSYLISGVHWDTVPWESVTVDTDTDTDTDTEDKEADFCPRHGFKGKDGCLLWVGRLEFLNFVFVMVANKREFLTCPQTTHILSLLLWFMRW